MSKRRRIVLIASAVLLVLTAAFFHRPAMPSQWHNLSAGMTHTEVLATLAPFSHRSDLRSEKGFESVTADTRIHGAAAYWQVLLRYDASDRLRSADTHFVDTACGLFNTESKPLLSPHPDT